MERVFSARCSTSRSSDRARLSASSSCSGANNLRPSGPAHASHVAHAVPTCACVLCRACRRAHASPLWTRAFAVRKADGAGEGERRGGRHIREELALKVAAFPRFRSDAQLLPSLLDSPARLLNSLAHLLHQLRVLLLVHLRCMCGASVLGWCHCSGKQRKLMYVMHSRRAARTADNPKRRRGMRHGLPARACRGSTCNAASGLVDKAATWLRNLPRSSSDTPSASHTAHTCTCE